MVTKDEIIIKEIIEYISEWSGPDPDRRAHPRRWNVKYDHLHTAIETLHKRKKLLKLRAYHFSHIHQMWNKGEETNKDLGYEMVDELMAHLNKNKYGSLMKTIENISINDFREEELIYKAKHHTIRYTLGPMIQKVKFDDEHKLSPYAALKYWIDNNPDKKIRKEFRDLLPIHLKKTSNKIYTGERGKVIGRFLVDQLMDRLIKRHGNLVGAILNISSVPFIKEVFKYKNAFGEIQYTLSSMFNSVRFDNKHVGSAFAALKYWADTHPNSLIRAKFSKLKPYHMPYGKFGLWRNEQGKKYGMELMTLLMERLTERYGSLHDAIVKLQAKDFARERFSFDTGDGVLYFSIHPMFQKLKFDDVHTLSPYSAVKYWITHNPDKKIRMEYADLRPEDMRNKPWSSKHK